MVVAGGCRGLRPRFSLRPQVLGAVRAAGFRDAGEHMRAPYDDADLEAQVTALWAQVSPLYRQLHAYVRRQLHRHYGDLVREDGPLPAHLLGK